MKESTNSKIHISNNFLLSVCLLIMLDTLLLGPSLHCRHFAIFHHTSPNYTSLHLSTLHFLSFTLHYLLILVSWLLTVHGNNDINFSQSWVFSTKCGYRTVRSDMGKMHRCLLVWVLHECVNPNYFACVLRTISQAHLTFLCSIIFYLDCECFGYVSRQEEINLSIEWN
jgi:hypothetical protein